MCRLSSSDHHSDGILCTNEAVNVLDFRVPTGIAKKFPTLGEETQSIFADGDGVYTGTTSYKSSRVQGDGTRAQCRLNQWSIRQGKLMNVYSFPRRTLTRLALPSRKCGAHQTPSWRPMGTGCLCLSLQGGSRLAKKLPVFATCLVQRISRTLLLILQVLGSCLSQEIDLLRGATGLE